MRKTLTSWSLLLGVLAWLIAALPALAQTGGGTISGRVLDPKGEPVIGATVLVQGTNKGAATDVDGNFTIREVPVGTYTVVVSSVGMNTFRQQVDVTAGGSATVTAAMTDNAAQLAEAVVVGYGTARRQDVTGSVATIDSRQFVQGQVTNSANLIVGKIAGVVVTAPTGAPGAGSPIRIRGGSSLNASNDPLIVIDGVAVDNKSIDGAPDALSTINPNDIETFTILKDASATAIYGSRASNGVILITTKKGLRGEKLRLNFNSQFSVSRPNNKVPVLSGDEFRALINQSDVSPTRPQASLATPEQKALLGTANTDWQDEIYRTAYTSDNNLSLMGSIAEKIPFRASVGYLNQQGTLRGGNLKRTTVSLGVTPMLLDDHLKIDVNAKGIINENLFANEGAIGTAVDYDPTQPVRSDDPRFAAFGGYFQWTVPNATTGRTDLVGLSPKNPVALLEQRRDRSTVYRGIGNVQLDYKLHFLPDLHANLNLGYDIVRSAGTTFIPADAGSDYNNATPSLSGSFNEYQQKKDNKLLDFFLSYGKNLGETGIRLDLTAGYSYQDFRYRTPSLPTTRAANGELKTPTNPITLASDQGYTLLSYFGRANLNFKDRYLLTGTLRNDQSSRFSKDNRSGYFPAVGFAWRVKGENFLATSTAVSDLKLRLGYGQTGQQDIVDQYYPAQPSYRLGDNTAQYQLGDQFYNTARAGGYNPLLKWETTTTYNAGLDYGFIDNRLYGTIDAYLRKTEDLISFVDFPAGSNLTNRLNANIGELENKGVEFGITGLPLRNDNMTWSISANATYNKQEITKLIVPRDVAGFTTGNIDGATGTQGQINAIGYQSSAFYVYNQLYSNGKPLLNAAGEPLFLTKAGDTSAVPTPDDRIIYKQWQPKVALGLSSNFSYKKASIAFSMRANLGNYLYNNVASRRSNYKQFLGNQTYLANGVDAINETNFTSNAKEALLSSYYVQEASFLRMDNVTFGYDLGSLIKEGTNLRLSVAVQNVFVITKYEGLDPEVFGGLDKQTYPRSRTFTLGVNASF
jgi:TonB-dependent starch-binding outer membrane protein SusC